MRRKMLAGDDDGSQGIDPPFNFCPGAAGENTEGVDE
jgi:hypothetical protein